MSYTDSTANRTEYSVDEAKVKGVAVMSTNVSQAVGRWAISSAVDSEWYPHLPKTESQGAADVDFVVHGLQHYPLEGACSRP